MEKKLNMRIAILVLVFFTFSLHQVLGQSNPLIKITEIDPNLPPGNAQIEEWVLNVLHGGGGVIDTNTITFTGNPAQIGRFDFGGPSIQLDSGLVISTGQVIQIQSYNTRYNDSYNFYGPEDPDLNKMTEELLGMPLFPPPPGGQHYTGDAAVLEFEYKPYGDQITLTYVFGSEEYLYWQFPSPPPGDINLTDGPYDLDRMYDVFGISIDRPARPFENIAIYQPAAADVTINSINDHSNDHFYEGNPVGPGSYGIQFDGFTIVADNLLVRKNVTPCLNYKVKIAIQDFLTEDPEDPTLKGFHYNSGVFLGGGSLIGGAATPTWTTDYTYTHSNPSFEGKIIEGGCNDLLITYTLDFESSSSDPYYIPFKIESDVYKDNLVITDESTGSIITIDSITFEKGDIQKTIRVSAVNVAADVPYVRFAYPLDPCERPIPPWSGGTFNGKVEFELVNNEPFSFSVDPKVYSAYCKETIDLTVTDITSGGVDPVSYIWPSNPVPPVDVYSYTVEASPDYVSVGVQDLCDNESTVQIRIDNKPIHLNDIPTISFCKPGMSQLVEVKADPDFNDFPDYGFSDVEWLSLAYTPPSLLGSGNPFLITYDDNFVEMLYEIKYNVTDVCGAKTTDTLTVDQTGKLDVGNNQYICLGESIDLVNYTPVFDNDPNNYTWSKRLISSSTIQVLGHGNSVSDTPTDTTVYYLEIYDKCEENQIDSLTVFVDHFMPQIVVSPSSKEVCPGESVTFTANTANSWEWTPGGATTQTITVTEFDPGVYTYTLTASSDYCLDKETSDSFEVFPQPAAVFSFNPAEEACTGEDIQFTYDDDPTGKEFNWDFADGATSTLQNPVHAYTNAGTYNVYLHVQQYICEDENTIPVVVNPLPSPDFTVDVNEGCLPVAVQFTDLSQDIFPGATYEWTFGDGSTSDLKNPSYVYDQAGWYSVGLSVYNTARCFASISKPKIIQVNPNPLANFEADPWITTMDDPEISFYNISDSDSTLIDFEWEFGDNGSSGDENPVHEYEQAGDYEILMRVETVNGCWDTIIGKVAVTEFVKLYIPSAFTPNGDGLNDYFQIKGTPVTDWNLYIYDRWGGIIWSTHNFETLWGGTDYEGNPVEPGSYVYQITGTDYKLEPVAFKGVVTVVK
jgi:gliding motility-associated-like protein